MFANHPQAVCFCPVMHSAISCRASGMAHEAVTGRK